MFSISIHPPREGWDARMGNTSTIARIFQSTHPARGGTYMGQNQTTKKWISIHPPREGWDLC